MKKIGKEVLFLSTGEKNPRNGEGSLLRLKDGRILYAYTQYYGDSWQDHATARVAACYSSDEGETWYDGGILIEKDPDALNIMSVSLMRMQNGDLGLLYLRKSMKGDDLLCMPYLVRSADEGKTFGEPVPCMTEDGYYVVNNDRLIRLKNGRLLIPAAYHGKSGNRGLLPGSLRVCCSDDDGQSWTMSPEAVYSPFRDDPTQLQEPGLYELPDGRVWMWCRTAYGHQYQCFSADGGETWGPVTPCLCFTSPDSPMQIREAGAYSVAVFNPLSNTCQHPNAEGWGSPKRTPYVCAVSRDGGLSFVEASKGGGCFHAFTASCYLLEDDQSESYCYPAILEVADGFLVAYYHSNGTGICLNSAKITKVRYDELIG